MTALYSNVSEVPLVLAVFLASDGYDHSTEQNEISATTLLKSLRQIILPSRVPPGQGLVNLSGMLKNRMGAAIHSAVEHAWFNNYKHALRDIGYPRHVIDKIRINPSKEHLQDLAADGVSSIPVYLEQRVKRNIGKWTVSGKFDFVLDGRVQDLKTTSAYSYRKQLNASKFIEQGSIYRWLTPDKITDSQMDIHYILTDWSRMQVNTNPDYPTKPIISQTYDLLSLPETENFISKKLRLIDEYRDAPEEDIPFCDEDELWRSEPVFKYYKNPDKTARSTKNFDNKQDAMLRLIEDGSVGVVREVPGQAIACKYCAAFAVCSQKDQLIASGDLILST